MMNKRRVIISGCVIVLVIVGLITYISVRHTPTPEELALAALPHAPEFELDNGAGGFVTLADSAGFVRIVYFWASWSPYAAAELPILSAVASDNGEGVVVLAVNRDTSSADGRAFLNTLGALPRITPVYDSVDGYFKAIEGFAVPETLILDGEGRIHWRKHGPLSEDELRRALATVLEKNTTL